MNMSWNEITKEMLHHYYCEELMSDQQIGKLFGVTRNQVSYKRRYFHITRQADIPVYDERILAYLRILGINHMIQTHDSRREIDKVLCVPFRLLETHKEYRNIRVSSFGNLLACSIEFNHKNSFDTINKFLSLLVQEYLGYHGCLLRGAITIGHMYHDEHFICGPSFVNAQMLERSIARFPRIIVNVRDLHHGLHTCEPAARREVKNRFVYSDDGYYYLDGFYYNRKQSSNVMLQRAKNRLLQMSYSSNTEREKVDWMRRELEREHPHL